MYAKAIAIGGEKPSLRSIYANGSMRTVARSVRKFSNALDRIERLEGTGRARNAERAEKLKGKIGGLACEVVKNGTLLAAYEMRLCNKEMSALNAVAIKENSWLVNCVEGAAYLTFIAGAALSFLHFSTTSLCIFGTGVAGTVLGGIYEVFVGEARKAARKCEKLREAVDDAKLAASAMRHA